MQITQHRSKARGLADLLLPFALIEDGILLQQDGSLLAGWSYRGPDMHSATHAEMHALTMRLNSILRLGSGWMLNQVLRQFNNILLVIFCRRRKTHNYLFDCSTKILIILVDLY